MPRVVIIIYLHNLVPNEINKNKDNYSGQIQLIKTKITIVVRYLMFLCSGIVKVIT